jgi:F-type H+-transporting ATPase subunit alpha
MKKVAGRLRIDLAQYRELEAFAAFGSELDKSSQAQLDRGARTVQLLIQPQFDPMPVEQQVQSIFAVTNGYFDDVPVSGIRRAEADLLEFLASRFPEIGREIAQTGNLDDVLEKKLREAIDEFKKGYTIEADAAEAAAR